MSDDRQLHHAREYSAWVWYGLPSLIVAAVLSEMFLPECAAFMQANAAPPTGADVAVAALRIAPSPQPGFPVRVSLNRTSPGSGSGRCESLAGLACVGVPDQLLGRQRGSAADAPFTIDRACANAAARSEDACTGRNIIGR